MSWIGTTGKTPRLLLPGLLRISWSRPNLFLGREEDPPKERLRGRREEKADYLTKIKRDQRARQCERGDAKDERVELPLGTVNRGGPKEAMRESIARARDKGSGLTRGRSGDHRFSEKKKKKKGKVHGGCSVERIFTAAQVS